LSFNTKSTKDTKGAPMRANQSPRTLADWHGAQRRLVFFVLFVLTMQPRARAPGFRQSATPQTPAWVPAFAGMSGWGGV
jgi:hypothetical protein